jgi:hypothetical protein
MKVVEFRYLMSGQAGMEVISEFSGLTRHGNPWVSCYLGYIGLSG